LAGELLRAVAGRAPSRLSGRVRAHVGFLPELLRGRLPRAPDGRSAAAADQAAVPAAGACMSPSLDSVSARIRAALGDDACLSAPEAVEPYLNDFRGLFRGATPLVVLPCSTAAVAAVLSICNEASVGVVPHGGNTSYCGGATPDATGRQIVL